MHPSIESRIAFHCAPVLIGDKTAAAVCLSAGDIRQLPDPQHMTALLSPYGARSFPLRRGAERTFLLVYAPGRLARHLEAERVSAALRALGYPVGGPLEGVLGELARRCGDGECEDCPRCQQSDFPHEIGFFLGYPYEDVAGFMLHGGRNYKYADMWKVYGDVDRAQALFGEYRACRAALTAHLSSGGNLGNFLPRDARDTVPGPI